MNKDIENFILLQHRSNRVGKEIPEEFIFKAKNQQIGNI